MINGNTQGIRQALLEQMETMQQIECERDEFLPEELMRQLARYTGLLGREISVYLSRGGDVLDVTVGDAQSFSEMYFMLFHEKLWWAYRIDSMFE